MTHIFAAIIALLFTLNTAARAEPAKVLGVNGKEAWYRTTPGIGTLKEALSETKAFLGANNPGYRMQAGPKLCQAMREVGLDCTYNTRGTLSTFLTLNGKGLFPASGGTNPYVRDFKDEEVVRLGPDFYIGQPVQNDMLLAAIIRNAALFKNGDLTAVAVKEKWRN